MLPPPLPSNPNFSPGPCNKAAEWSIDSLKNAFVGRSHRAKEGVERICAVIDLSRELLGIPDDYYVALVPGSDTGAFEMAMWNMLGARGVDVLAWDAFGKIWLSNAKDILKLKDLREFRVDACHLPDLSQTSSKRDIIFTWNGTTSGVRIPNGDWIADDREGLTFCDATSALFTMEVPWEKLDVTTWSWQKGLGGEAAHGMIAFSPRAIERLNTYTPPWPIPSLLRLVGGRRSLDALFQGATINTPSMLCIEDALWGLNWAKKQGGLKKMIEKTQENYACLAEWVEKTPWIDFMAKDPFYRSVASVGLKFTVDDGQDIVKLIDDMLAFLEKEKAAFDIKHHPDAPPSIRIWCGPTIEKKNIKALLPWLEYAFQSSHA